MDVKIMQWNIEAFSDDKSQIFLGGVAPPIPAVPPGAPPLPAVPPGPSVSMMEVTAEIVNFHQVDILIILELKINNADLIMSRLSAALNAKAGGTLYQTYFYSEETGTDRYGFIIRDTNDVRPLSSNTVDGVETSPLVSMTQDSALTAITFSNAFATSPNLSITPLNNRKAAFLVDLFATNPPRGRTNATFAGQASASDRGYSQGKGYRLPCLAMFEIVGAAAPHPIIPIVCCHYGAVRNQYARNKLAKSQIESLKHLHIAQLYAIGGSINTNTGLRTVSNIIFTGDYNIDFLMNYAGNNLNTFVQEAYQNLTGTQRKGGSNQAGAGTAPGVTTAAVIAPGGGVAAPAIPDGTHKPIKRPTAPLNDLNTLTAVTNEGTILRHYHIGQAAIASTYELRGACFDNFFFGGAELNAAAPNGKQFLGYMAPPPLNMPHLNAPAQVGHPPVVAFAQDCGKVIDVPQMITQNNPPGAGEINLKDVAYYYAIKKSGKRDAAGNPVIGVKNAIYAPNLRVAGALLNNNDKLIGARMVSDHLPVMVEFTFP